MQSKNSNISTVIKNINEASVECSKLISKLQTALQNVHYLAAILLMKAKERQYPDEIISTLQDDIRYASNLRFEDLQVLNDKILEFLVDFSYFISNDKSIKKLLK